MIKQNGHRGKSKEETDSSGASGHGGWGEGDVPGGVVGERENVLLELRADLEKDFQDFREQGGEGRHCRTVKLTGHGGNVLDYEA